jgi:pimeloyl-ACP methyl ester carboxylesterase
VAEKPPILIVHGLGDSARAWGPVADRLQTRFRVVVPDLPGHGRAKRLAEYSYDGLRDEVELEAKIAGLERFALVGHSVGGNIAWLLAKKRPELVSKLVLIEAAAPHRTSFAQAPLPDARHPYPVASPEDYARFLGLDAREVVEDLVRRADGMWEPAFDARLFPGLAQGYRDAGAFWEGASRVTMPVLVVRGDASFANTRAAEEFLEHVPDGRAVVLAGADHFVHRKHPDLLVAALGDFLT